MGHTVEEIFSLVDIESCSAKQLFHDGLLEKIVVSKMGQYVGQSLETILRTKLVDLSMNRQKFLGHGEVDPSLPLCIWFFGGRKDSEFFRKSLRSDSGD